MEYSKKENNNNGENIDGMSFLTLSLFIILLAFFIIINASSNYDISKSKPVMRSLKETFASKVAGDNNSPAMIDNHLELDGLGEVFDNLDKLLLAQGFTFTADRSDATGDMFVRLKEEEWASIISGIDNQRASDHDFLDKLSIMMLPDDKDIKLSLQILIGLGDNPAELFATEPYIVNSAVKRADIYAKNFIDIGLPKELVFIGLHEGEIGYIDLKFSSQSTKTRNLDEVLEQGQELYKITEDK